MGCCKSFVSSVKKAVKHTLSPAVDFTKNTIDAVEDFVADPDGTINNIVDNPGYYLGEVTPWSEDQWNSTGIPGAIGTVFGDKQDSAEELSDLNDEIEELNEGIEDFSTKLVGMQMIFDDEIFLQAYQNKIDRLVAQLNPLIDEYDELYDEYKSKYGPIDNLGHDLGVPGAIIAGTLELFGSLVNSVEAIVEGDANSSDWQAIGTLIVGAILIYVGLQTDNATLVKLGAAMIIGLIVTIDLQNGGHLLDAVMGIIDLVLNDIFHADDLGCKFCERFDRKSEYYEETKTLLGTAIIISAAVYSMVSGGIDGLDTTGMTTAQATAMTAVGYYSEANATYQTAKTANDIITMNKTKAELEQKAQEDIDKLNEKYENYALYKFNMQYKSLKEMYKGTELMYDQYVLSIEEDMTDVVDPAAIVSMSGFDYDSTPNAISFGFEDMFEYEDMAGGSNYYDNILLNWGHEQHHYYK